MTIYLYKKTHLITGLMYLGKTTSSDPYSYSGSGKYWKRHLHKHGFVYETEILKECVTTDEVKYWGEYYSILWNVVESNEWANLKPESGDGGDAGPKGRRKIAAAQTGRKHSPEENEHKSKRQTGVKRSPEYLAKKLGLKYKKPKPRTEPNKNKDKPGSSKQFAVNKANGIARIGIKQTLDTCPHCGKIGGSQTMPRWHFDNCKFKSYTTGGNVSGAIVRTLDSGCASDTTVPSVNTV